MTKLSTWVEASLKIFEDNIKCLEECYKQKQFDLMILQTRALKEHTDSFLSLLEKRLDDEN